MRPPEISALPYGLEPQNRASPPLLLQPVSMRPPAWCVLCVLASTVVFGCSDPARISSACFDTASCSSGVCTVTVYGNYCLSTCTADIIRCDDGQACVQGEGLPSDGGVDGGLDAGVDGGTDADSGVEGEADFWVCLPGELDNEDFTPVLIGEVCTYSIDCELGGICVCLDGQNCDLENVDRDGPVCVEACDATVVSLCPFQQACLDLGNGRGFCDPASTPTN